MYLGYSPDILIAILLREPKVLIQSEAYIVAVQPIRTETQVEQVLL